MSKKSTAVQQDQLTRIIQNAVSTFTNAICQVAIQMRVDEYNKGRTPATKKPKAKTRRKA
jgi:hypothetical protein